jgi:hypothetical protein
LGILSTLLYAQVFDLPKEALDVWLHKVSNSLHLKDNGRSLGCGDMITAGPRKYNFNNSAQVVVCARFAMHVKLIFQRRF